MVLGIEPSSARGAEARTCNTTQMWPRGTKRHWRAVLDSPTHLPSGPAPLRLPRTIPDLPRGPSARRHQFAVASRNRHVQASAITKHSFKVDRTDYGEDTTPELICASHPRLTRHCPSAHTRQGSRSAAQCPEEPRFALCDWPRRLLVAANGILVGAHAGRPALDRAAEECEMLTELCRSVFMQFGRWIVI